jgi:hypothetical protein
LRFIILYYNYNTNTNIWRSVEPGKLFSIKRIDQKWPANDAKWPEMPLLHFQGTALSAGAIVKDGMMPTARYKIHRQAYMPACT